MTISEGRRLHRSSLMRAIGHGLPEAALDVVLDDAMEVLGDALAAQRHRLPAVDEHRSRRRLAGAGQADADVGMLALAGAVDDAAHDRDSQRLDAGITLAPARHHRAQVVVDALGEHLEGLARRAPAARTGGDARVEAAQAERLQHLERDHDRSEERRVGKECRSRWSPY